MYQDRIIIDGLQYCNWDRAYFETLKASGITAVHATLVYHETARETSPALPNGTTISSSTATSLCQS